MLNFVNALCSGNYSNPINKPFGQNALLLNVTAIVTCNHCTLKDEEATSNIGTVYISVQI